MAIQRLSGALTGGLTGLHEFASGATPTAAEINQNWQDPQTPGLYSRLSGVLEGGVCTAVALDVRVPDGTIWLARMVWQCDGDEWVSVPDDAVTYIWGTSDGQLVIEPTAGIPAGYDGRTACLITKATAAAGVITIDNTVQYAAEYADIATRAITHPNPETHTADVTFSGGAGINGIPDAVSAGQPLNFGQCILSYAAMPYDATIDSDVTLDALDKVLQYGAPTTRHQTFTLPALALGLWHVFGHTVAGAWTLTVEDAAHNPIVVLTTGQAAIIYATSVGWALGGVMQAANVKITDVGSCYTATDVEAALHEVKDIADLALPKAGGTMGGNIAMSGTQKLTGLAAGSAAGDSVRYEELIKQGVQTFVNNLNALSIAQNVTNYFNLCGYRHGTGTRVDGQTILYDYTHTAKNLRAYIGVNTLNVSCVISLEDDSSSVISATILAGVTGEATAAGPATIAAGSLCNFKVAAAAGTGAITPYTIQVQVVTS